VEIDLFPILPENVSLAEYPDKQDFIMGYYRDPSTRASVIDFFTSLVHSRSMATVILEKADRYDISPSIAFALCWEESRFKARALNSANRNGTTDRGLFQLNSASFPNLSEEDFFNMNTNTQYAMSHLRWCIDQGGSEVAGLAMYNAGTGRVDSGGTPKQTLNYVSRIIANSDRIEQYFAALTRPELAPSSALALVTQDALSNQSTLISATPLAN
jgi:soluble lytic murein transglycosylase-like protein